MKAPKNSMEIIKRLEDRLKLQEKKSELLSNKVESLQHNLDSLKACELGHYTALSTKIADTKHAVLKELQVELQELHATIAHVSRSLQQGITQTQLDIVRIDSKSKDALEALDLAAFNTHRAATQVALQAHRRDVTKDLMRLNTRVDKLKERVSSLLPSDLTS